jgi:hypothetical protein
VTGKADKEFAPATPPLGVRGRAILEVRVQVRAQDLWRLTDVHVNKGDWVDFVARGSWWSGISSTGPDGDNGLFGLMRPSCSACPVSDGNLGQLVGKVGSYPPFGIGARKTEFVRAGGIISLAMNDNLGPCAPGNPGSCYSDNEGTMEVKITVWRDDAAQINGAADGALLHR